MICVPGNFASSATEPRPGTARTIWKATCVAVDAAGLLSGCVASARMPVAVDCAPLPDARETLAQAWNAYQPNPPISPAVTIRRRLFAFQALLLSASIYNEPPSDPATVYTQYVAHWALGPASFDPALDGCLFTTVGTRTPR